MKAIVRRDSGETYEKYLKQLAQAEGIENPTRSGSRPFSSVENGGPRWLPSGLEQCVTFDMYE